MSDGRVQAVERAIDVVMCLRQGPRTLTEVSRATKLSKGTAFRLLNSLSYQGLVAKDSESSLYMLGPGCLSLIDGVTAGLGGIVGASRESILMLWQHSGETVTLHVRMGAERVCVYELPTAHPIRYMALVGGTAPIHVGSAGKVILAALAPAALEKLMSNLAMVRLTDHTITDRAALLAELAEVREQGYAVSAGERVPGAASISVAVRGPLDMTAAVSVLGPESRLSRDRMMALLPELKSAAQEIERALGAGGDGDARRRDR